MKRFVWLVVFSLVAITTAQAKHARSGPGPALRERQGVNAQVPLSFDSLNCRLIGNWPFGLCYAVAYDSSRSLAFMESGGGVYVLDVSNPTQPVKLSEAIRMEESMDSAIWRAGCMS